MSCRRLDNVQEGTGQVVPLDEIMQSYDSLPAEWKRLLGAAPEPLDPREFAEVVRRGIPLERVKTLLRQRYPDWRIEDES